MKTLVVPDIHHKYKTVQKLLDTLEYDNVVFTGDYFDDYSDNPQEAADTAKWLKENILYNPKITVLTGNHDTSYLFKDNIFFRCSGYTNEKNKRINEVLSDEDKLRFKVYHIEQGYVFSHAGLSNQKWKEYSSKFSEQAANESKVDFFDRVMKVISKEALDSARSGNDTTLFAAGWERGGIYKDGGINWVDWTNLSPVKGINQIVGHTTHRVPQVMVQRVGGGYKKGDVTDIDANKNDSDISSVSYNLDTRLNHYAIIDDGIVNIFHIHTNTNLKDVKNIYLPENPMNGF